MILNKTYYMTDGLTIVEATRIGKKRYRVLTPAGTTRVWTEADFWEHTAALRAQGYEACDAQGNVEDDEPIVLIEE